MLEGVTDCPSNLKSEGGGGWEEEEGWGSIEIVSQKVCVGVEVGGGVSDCL